jgi:hypothetical protein
MGHRDEFNALVERLNTKVARQESTRMSAVEIATLRRVLEVREVIGWLSSFAAMGLYLGAVWLLVPASRVSWHWFGMGAVVCAAPFGGWFLQSRRGERVLDRAEAGTGVLRAADASKILKPLPGALALAASLSATLCLLVWLLPA